MKADLRTSPSCLLSLCFALCLGVSPVRAISAGQNTDSPQNNAATHPNIEVEKWAKPQPGWLYVLDPKPETGPGGRVRLLDPGSAKVMGSIRTGDNGDFALSPDGSRLYVASITEGDSSELAVIDTAAGVILQRSSVQYREVADVIPSFSAMAVSGDGLALRILIDAPKSETADSFSLATFDTGTGEFLPRNIHLGNCGPGRFITHKTEVQFDFQCPRSNRIRLIQVDTDSHEIQNVDIVLPWERRTGVAEAIEVSGSETISILRGDGGIFQMNLATEAFAETAAKPVVPNRIPPAAWPTSPDGSRIYVGYSDTYNRPYDNRFYLNYGRPPNLRPDTATAAEFHVYDTHNWRKVGTIKTKMPFWSAVLGNDGKALYAIAPLKHSILVIDTVRMHQTRILKVGGAPTLALVAP